MINQEQKAAVKAAVKKMKFGTRAEYSHVTDIMDARIYVRVDGSMDGSVEVGFDNNGARTISRQYVGPEDCFELAVFFKALGKRLEKLEEKAEEGS